LSAGPSRAALPPPPRAATMSLGSQIT
jgi:hypothetical protein